MSQNAMPRPGRCAFAMGHNQFAPAQTFQRELNGALGETGSVGQIAQTHGNRFPLPAHRLAIKIHIYEIGDRMFIVADQIAHQDIDHVIVHGKGLFEAGIAR